MQTTEVFVTQGEREVARPRRALEARARRGAGLEAARQVDAFGYLTPMAALCGPLADEQVVT